MRFGDDDELVDGAPVAIIALRTDTEDDFIFQMDADDLRRTIKRLEDTERKLRSGGKIIDRLIK